MGAERELRLALTQAQTYEAIFGAQFKDVMAAVLALFLAEHARRDEVMVLARPISLSPRATRASRTCRSY